MLAAWTVQGQLAAPSYAACANASLTAAPAASACTGKLPTSQAGKVLADGDGVWATDGKKCTSSEGVAIPGALELRPAAPMAMTRVQLGHSDAPFPLDLTFSSPGGNHSATCTALFADCPVQPPLLMAPGALPGAYMLAGTGGTVVALASVGGVQAQ